jgi:hypothetical protein
VSVWKTNAIAAGDGIAPDKKAYCAWLETISTIKVPEIIVYQA